MDPNFGERCEDFGNCSHSLTLLPRECDERRVMRVCEENGDGVRMGSDEVQTTW
jgi:hypothetical protein